MQKAYAISLKKQNTSLSCSTNQKNKCKTSMYTNPYDCMVHFAPEGNRILLASTGSRGSLFHCEIAFSYVEDISVCMVIKSPLIISSKELSWVSPCLLSGWLPISASSPVTSQYTDLFTENRQVLKTELHPKGGPSAATFGTFQWVPQKFGLLLPLPVSLSESTAGNRLWSHKA